MLKKDAEREQVEWIYRREENLQPWITSEPFLW